MVLYNTSVQVVDRLLAAREDISKKDRSEAIHTCEEVYHNFQLTREAEGIPAESPVKHRRQAQLHKSSNITSHQNNASSASADSEGLGF